MAPVRDDATPASLSGVVDLVLTDVIMPRMSGPELVGALRASRPELRVLFFSGHADEVLLRQGLLDAGVRFLRKPFGVDELLSHVRELLDDPQGANKPAR